MSLKQQKFCRCINCNSPFLFKPKKRKHGKGENLSVWCKKCKRERQKQFCRDFYKRYGTYKYDRCYRVMVNQSAFVDKRKFAPDYDYRSSPRYITSDSLKAMRQAQKNRCYFCDKVMNSKCRKGDDGLTIERLDDGPHWADTCVMSCLGCNRRSWREKWCPYPLKLAKILGHEVVNGYLEGLEEGTRWTFIEATRTWIPNGVIPYTLPNRLPSRLCVARQARLLAELFQQLR